MTHPPRGALFASALLWNLCNGMLFVLTPLLGVTLGLSVLDIGSLVGLPYLVTIVMRFVGGAFADRYGEHRMLQACYSLNLLAAVALSAAGGFFSLMLSSFLSNLSRSMFWVPAQSMASQLSDRNPGKMLGQLSAANYTGQVLGLSMGGVLAGWLGYGHAFVVVIMGSVIGMLLGFALPPIRLKPGDRTVWQITAGMGRRLLQRRTWLLISSSCAAAVPFGITQSVYPVYMSGLDFSEGWISVIISVRSIGPVAIGLALGSMIVIEREKLFYAVSMGGLGVCILGSAWTGGWPVALCIAGLGMAGAVADLLNQVQAVDLSRASDRSAVMASTGLGWNMSPMALPLALGWVAETWGFGAMFAATGGFFLLVALGTPLVYRTLDAPDPLPDERGPRRIPGESGPGR